MSERYKIFTRTFVIFSMFLTDLRRNSSSRKVAMLRTCADATVAVGCAEAVRRIVRVKSDMGDILRIFQRIFQSCLQTGQPRTSLPTLVDYHDWLARTITVIMADEPLFDPSLKKRKKKTVAFTEDPLGPEADPTAPAPETIDSTTVNGDPVDLGPTTAHEAMMAGQEKKDENDEFKAMFGDLKKKKKKKEIPLDLVCQLV